MKTMVGVLIFFSLCLIAVIVVNIAAPTLGTENNPAALAAQQPAEQEADESQPMTDLPDKPEVLIKTSMGNIKILLFSKKAPITVNNFLQYVKSKHYDGTIFHRVIPGFMIQGGNFTKDMQQKSTRSAIKNEADNKLSNERGTIAMARTSMVHSATDQFFINAKNNTFLDHKSKSPDAYGYCVFGKVIDGMDVVDKIISVETTSKGGHSDVPVTPVEIKEMSLIPQKTKPIPATESTSKTQ